MTAVNQVGNALTGSTGSGAFVGDTSPTLVTPVLGAASATSVSFSSTSEIIGTTTNNNAATGSVGEYVEANQDTPQAVTSNTPLNITSISLTAGDWDVWGQINFAPAATTTVSYISTSVSTTSATVNGTTGFVTILSLGAQVVNDYVTHTDCINGPVRLSLSTTTTVYLVGATIFGTSTMAATGIIQARRVR